MKILITEPEYFPKNLVDDMMKNHDVVAKKTNYEDLLKEVDDVDVLIIRVESKIDKKILEKAKNLKVIASMTTGLDHIDIEEAKKKNIEIINLPGYASTATAEYTMSIILSLIRKVPWAFESFKQGKRERHLFLGAELDGKTLGLVGFGKIGSKVGKYAKAFGMNVIFFDPYIEMEKLKDIEAERVDSLDDILEKSDVISIHAFLSKDTEKMINKDKFSKMKENTIIVNAARGMIIDESDLVDALENKSISGAALDVFEQEPLPHSHKLIDYAKSHDNLLLTPHMAGSTQESIHNVAKFITEKILGMSEK